MGFVLVRCGECRHRYSTEVHPPQRLSQDYYNESPEALASRVDSKRVRFSQYRDVCEALNRPGRVLDVGCNAGELLSLFREHGWQVAGIEPSPAPARLAQSSLGAPIFNGALEDYEDLGAGFDVVTMTHVLEHLVDPVAALRKLRRLALPTGHLLVEVPNAEDAMLDLFGGFYRPLCPGDHVSFFNRDSLSHVLERSGWQVVKIIAPLHARDIVYGALLSTIDAFRMRRTEAPTDGVVSQYRYRGPLRRPAKRLLDRAVQAADSLVVPAQRWLAPNRGAVLIAVARRI